MTVSRIEDVLPLSPLQEGLLFLSRYDDQGSDDVYVVQFRFDVAGPWTPTGCARPPRRS